MSVILKGSRINGVSMGAYIPVLPGFLSHFDGDFIDQRGHALSPYPPGPPYNATISTAFKKFGSGSADTTVGLARYVSNDFVAGTGDVTFEGWVYPLTSGVTMSPFGVGSGTNAQDGSAYNGMFSLVRWSDDTLYILVEGGTLIGPGNAISANVWSHIMVSRTAGNYYIGVNGTITTVTRAPDNAYSNVLIIGEHGVNNTQYRWNGYVDDVRLTIGTALYTGSSYTVPTGPLS